MIADMAEEAPVTAPADVPTAAVVPESTEPAQINGDDAPATTEKGDAADVGATNGTDESAVNDHADDAGGPPTTTATPASKDKKRKSTGGVPEHKGKKLNKKKSMPALQLHCKPGQFYWARLKGYPPWPSVICDESMLPESLLATRPVSTARPDGTIRPDFEEGGKNARERTFPIMFLSTNEFQWMVNTSLTPLDPEECKNASKSKMTKALQNAYEIASEDHDLQYFKDILVQWQEENEALAKAEAAARAEADRIAAEKAAAGEQESKEKSKKKASRKSKAADEDEDMVDTEAPKSSKKRKKDAESDADAPKPKKTPKVTKLNAPKTPNGDESTKKSKSKKKVVTAPKAEEEDEPQAEMTEQERLAVRFKTILYLRHRLQKGFLTRDKAPEESEMAEMNKHLATLEGHQDLEVNIIKETKIHKVLKGIVKLASVPRDDEFQFKKRSSALLENWNQRIDAAGDVPSKPVADDDNLPATNGEAHVEATTETHNGHLPETDREEKQDKPVNVEEPATTDAQVPDALMDEQKETGVEANTDVTMGS